MVNFGAGKCTSVLYLGSLTSLLQSWSIRAPFARIQSSWRGFASFSSLFYTLSWARSIGSSAGVTLGPHNWTFDDNQIVGRRTLLYHRQALLRVLAVPVNGTIFIFNFKNFNLFFGGLLALLLCLIFILVLYSPETPELF